MRLPVMIVHSERGDVRREHPRAEALAPLGELPDLTGVRVVAVEDEKDALALLRVVLETAGATVTTVDSPGEALATIDEVMPDAVILDIGMPEMDASS